jgi:serine/threonine-protein kinase
LVWIDAQGQVEVVEGFDKPLLGQLQLSPDGRYVAFVERSISGALWLFDLERATHVRLLSEGIAGFPVWSPDGNKVAFAWSSGGPQNVWLLSVNQKEDRIRLTDSENMQFPASWSHDGKYLAIWESGDILIYDFGRARLEPLLDTDSVERFPVFSPDGRWLAYVTDETERPEVYVTSFPDKARTLMISNEGGVGPIWSPSAAALFYRGPKGFMKVKIHAAEGISAGVPHLMFDPSRLGLAQFPWDPVSGFSIDGKGERFLVSRMRPPPVGGDRARSKPITRLNLVVNWFDELERLCPKD